jgi:hypothetical protein
MIKLLIATGLAFGLAASTLQGGTIIYTSFDANQSYNTSSARVVGNVGGSSYEDAMPFLARTTAALGSITTPIYNVLTPNAVNFSINADNAGVPGTLLESWSLTGLSSGQPLVKMTSILNPTLTAGTKYWLIASVSGTSTRDNWGVANPDQPSGIKYSITGGASWANGSGNTTLDAFEVDSDQPLITSATVSGNDLVLNAANGLSGRTYYTLTSTNAASSPGQWTPIATNLLSASGSFTITATNAVSPAVGQSFYILQLQ